MNIISSTQFREMFNQAASFAPIDTREEGDFARAHLLCASNLPLSRLEQLIDVVIPRKHTPIVLCSNENATASVERLTSLGYTNISMLAGGISGWALNGGKLFSGINVIGKAFGEFIEKSKHTPSIGAVELKTLLASAAPPILLDTRTWEEHRSYCIPGALACPNGELVYRAMQVAQSPEQIIVTHCAGRTRSIIGAQTLIDAGVPNPVVSLENGTLAWIFEDYELEKGANRPLPSPGTEKLSASEQAAARLRSAHAIDSLSQEAVQRCQEDPDATTYVIDVRTKEEFEKAHWPGSVHVPGGQLVQNIERYLLVRNAKVVLIDSDSIRATSSAAWLKQLGWQAVFTYQLPTDSALLQRSEPPPKADEPDDKTITALIQDTEQTILDCRTSVTYRRGHIPGAWFFTRANVVNDSARLPRGKRVVLHYDDALYASLLVKDLQALGFDVQLLEVSPERWLASGGEIETEQQRFASAPNDVFFDAEDFDDLQIQRREGRAYLEWEIGLVHQLDDDPGAPYMKS